jgi:zona occludens toxin (predicted ATPase)
VLEKAALLPDERSGPAEATGNAEQTGDGLFSSKRLRFFAATVLLMLVFLLVLLSGWG